MVEFFFFKLYISVILLLSPLIRVNEKIIMNLDRLNDRHLRKYFELSDINWHPGSPPSFRSFILHRYCLVCFSCLLLIFPTWKLSWCCVLTFCQSKWRQCRFPLKAPCGCQKKGCIYVCYCFHLVWCVERIYWKHTVYICILYTPFLWPTIKTPTPPRDYI